MLNMIPNTSVQNQEEKRKIKKNVRTEPEFYNFT